jgi:hypothetical protein
MIAPPLAYLCGATWHADGSIRRCYSAGTGELRAFPELGLGTDRWAYQKTLEKLRAATSGKSAMLQRQIGAEP